MFIVDYLPNPLPAGINLNNMEINVKIKWDTPGGKHWLNPDNIATALSAYCKNTTFEVSEITPNKITDYDIDGTALPIEDQARLRMMFSTGLIKITPIF